MLRRNNQLKEAKYFFKISHLNSFYSDENFDYLENFAESEKKNVSDKVTIFIILFTKN